MLDKKKKYIENETITIRNFIDQIVDKVAESENFDGFKKEKLVNSIIKDNRFKKYLDRQISAKYKNKNVEKYMKVLKENKQVFPKITDFEQRVIEVLCEAKGIEFDKIRTTIRERYYVEARQCAFYIFKSIFQYTYSRTGFIFMRDHSTVIHGIETHENLMSTDSSYRDTFIQALDQLIEEFPEKFKNYTTAKLKNSYGRKQRS